MNGSICQLPVCRDYYVLHCCAKTAQIGVVFELRRNPLDKKKALVFKAGRGAMDIIRRDGFSPEQIGSIAGASGGAKWLAISQIDRVV